MERGWIVASILYGAFRCSLVGAFLRQYGVNPKIFIAVEMVSSGFYGWTGGRAVVSIIDAQWHRLRRWGPFAILFYIAPDAYVFASAGRMSGDIYSLLLSIVGVAVVVTVVGIVIQVRKGRSLNSLRTTSDNCAD